MFKLVCINTEMISIFNTDKNEMYNYNGRNLKEFNFYTTSGEITLNQEGYPVYFIEELQEHKLCERFEILDDFKKNTVSYLDQTISKEYQLK